jgi:hypothetical protein
MLHSGQNDLNSYWKGQTIMVTIQAAISLEVTFGTRRFRIASNDGSAIVCGSLEERGQTELRILRRARRCGPFGGAEL